MLHVFSDWAGEVDSSWDLRMKAVEKGKHKQIQQLKQNLEKSWKQWKHICLVSKSCNIHSDNYQKKNIVDLIQKILMNRIMKVWKYRQQVIIRSKRLTLKSKHKL